MDKNKKDLINIINLLHEIVGVYKNTYKERKEKEYIDFNFRKYIKDDGSTDIFKYLSILVDNGFITVDSVNYPIARLNIQIKGFMVNEELNKIKSLIEINNII